MAGCGIAVRSSIDQYQQAAKFNVREEMFRFDRVEYDVDPRSNPALVFDLRGEFSPLGLGVWEDILELGFHKRTCFVHGRDGAERYFKNGETSSVNSEGTGEKAHNGETFTSSWRAVLAVAFFRMHARRAAPSSKASAEPPCASRVPSGSVRIVWRTHRWTISHTKSLLRSAPGWTRRISRLSHTTRGLRIRPD